MARPTGARLIAAERRRQIEVEGWTAEHDRRHSRGELAMAAQAYVDTARKAQAAAKGKLKLQADFWKLSPPAAWPWALSCWKPADHPVRNLVKAGALIAAEIDRILNEQEPSNG